MTTTPPVLSERQPNLKQPQQQQPSNNQHLQLPAYILPAVSQHSKRVRAVAADGQEEEADDNPWVHMQLKDPFQQVRGDCVVVFTLKRSGAAVSEGVKGGCCGCQQLAGWLGTDSAGWLASVSNCVLNNVQGVCLVWCQFHCRRSKHSWAS